MERSAALVRLHTAIVRMDSVGNLRYSKKRDASSVQNTTRLGLPRNTFIFNNQESDSNADATRISISLWA